MAQYSVESIYTVQLDSIYVPLRGSIKWEPTCDVPTRASSSQCGQEACFYGNSGYGLVTEIPYLVIHSKIELRSLKVDLRGFAPCIFDLCDDSRSHFKIATPDFSIPS